MSTQISHAKDHPIWFMITPIAAVTLGLMIYTLPRSPAPSAPLTPAHSAADEHAANSLARYKATSWVISRATDPSSVKIWASQGIRDPETKLNVFHIDFTATNGFGGPTRNLFGLVVADDGAVIEVKDERSGKLYVVAGREK